MKKNSLWLVALLWLWAVLLAWCGKTEVVPVEENAEVPNPASVFCEENSGSLFFEIDEEWNQTGLCMFEDWSYCEEWAYYRAECQPGEIMYNTEEDLIGMPNPAAVYCVEQGGELVPMQDENGEYSLCRLADWTEVEEWEYYYANHAEATEETAEEQTVIGMPNPAAVYCGEQGWETFTVTDEQGAQLWMCRLPSGIEVDEWEYYNANNTGDEADNNTGDEVNATEEVAE